MDRIQYVNDMASRGEKCNMVIIGHEGVPRLCDWRGIELDIYNIVRIIEPILTDQANIIKTGRGMYQHNSVRDIIIVNGQERSICAHRDQDTSSLVIHGMFLGGRHVHHKGELKDNIFTCKSKKVCADYLTDHGIWMLHSMMYNCTEKGDKILDLTEGGAITYCAGLSAGRKVLIPFTKQDFLISNNK